ncbi:hypothetical protein K7432_015759 [Basidiobolus ranarum]|uniref:Uncharacterized protein n=1 Tax=Basidiobolus ranarum TaxID=34480 RepID=A0ABR2WFQ5_9FUNG
MLFISITLLYSLSDAYDGEVGSIQGDSDPKDCQGHGAHVAGIIGAHDSNFVGVAPDVTLGAYKVFGCDEGPPDGMIIKGVEMAVTDKMDVINLSLGGALPYSDDPISRALNNDAGVVVVVAAGNDGMSGLWTIGSPSTATNAIGVASFDHVKYPGQSFTINEDKDWWVQPIKGRSYWKVRSLLQGRILRTVKGVNAQNAGAVGAFVYSSTSGAYIATTMDPSLKIPLMGLQVSDAAYLNDLFTKNKNLSITFDTEHKLYENPNGGKLSSFTAWGPDFELNFKPDVGAPGGLIYSTFLIAKGSYAHLRAGAVKELNFDGIASAAKQGARLINVWDAICANTLVSPSKFSFNDTTHLKDAHTFTVTNNGEKSVTYAIKHVPAVSVNGYDKKGYPTLQNPFVFSGSSAVVRLSPSTVTVRPGQSKQVKVVFSPPKFDKKDLWIYSGYVHFKPLNSEDNEVSVPYAGVAGDLHSITVIDTKGERQPSVVSLVSGAPKKVYSLVGNDVPLLRKGKELGLIGLVEGGFSRNYPGTDIKVTFDGSIIVVKNGRAQEVEAPSGTYTLTVKGFKPFGNPNTPADFDTWTSAPFEVKRAN